MGVLPGGTTRASPRSRGLKAVAFDGFAIFDPTPVLALAELVVPGRGRELVVNWRSRQFEYQWLRTLGGRYADFRQTAGDALTVSAKALGIPMSGDQRERLLSSYLTLVPWPDTVGAIRALRAAGLRLAFLSNMTESMLDDGARRAGVRDAFEVVLSTDRVRAAKTNRLSAPAEDLGTTSIVIARDLMDVVAFASRPA
jgi:2-haloacid dehalogenase